MRHADERRWRVRAAVLLTLVVLGCRTREDSARELAKEAARLGDSLCRDAGDREACREPICRDRCAPFHDSPRLRATCVDKCMARGTCSTDSDCDHGSVCETIAPRVRRCQPPGERGDD